MVFADIILNNNWNIARWITLITVFPLLILGIITSVLIIRERKQKTSIWYIAFLIAGLLFFLSFGGMAYISRVVYLLFNSVILLSWIVITIRLFIKERKNA